jgi:hypothetical protein
VSRLARARRIVTPAAVAATCMLGLLVGVGVGACVDGQTPDCSDAAAGCGPDNDGSVPVDTGADGEAGADAATGDTGADAPADSPKDAPVDAPVDASDAADAGDAKAG